MKRYAFMVIVFLALGYSRFANAAGDDIAVVVLVDDGGIGPASARTACRIFADELRRLGVEVAESPDLEQVHPLDDTIKQEMARVGAGRIFVLSLLQLGNKLIAKVELRSADFTILSSRQLTASGPEELDVVIPRLTEALIKNTSVGESARIDTVTAQEGRKWEKLPGEFLWGFGIILGGGLSEGTNFIYGLDFQFSYEMEHFQLRFQLGGMANFDDEEKDGLFRTGVGATYIPFTSFWSPFLGVSLDYVYLNLGGYERGGVGLIVHGGVEFFRLHSSRLVVGLDLVVPFFEIRNDYPEDYKYRMAIFGTVAVLW